MNIPKLVFKYLRSRKNAWSQNTLRSERHRLRALVKARAITGNPQELWDHLERAGTAKYTRCTTWVRVSGFWNWCIQEGHTNDSRNPYRKFRSDNARFFKDAYVRKPASINRAEADVLVGQIDSPQSQALARQLLHSGLRFEESFSLQGTTVQGKTGKREVFGVEAKVHHPESYRTFLRRCKAVGLKGTHELRKVAASHFVQRGASEWDLLSIMGWTTVDTARSYVATKTRKELHEFVRKANIK